MITLVDYGVGNVKAFFDVYKSLNISVSVAQSASELCKASRVILPGVGAFDWAMSKLNSSGMRECLEELALVKQVPVLGVCVGMQMLANSSDEGTLNGLGWIDATVKKLNDDRSGCSTFLPHMGWNNIEFKRMSNLLTGLESSKFYFLHSYYFCPRESNVILAETNYGIIFPSVVGRDQIFGAQFHPEKSHSWGRLLLKNFAEL